MARKFSSLIFFLFSFMFLNGLSAFAQSEPQGITDPIRGKRIVIDPGHGGEYHGAIGNAGLRESEVNLAVALHLWGMLQAAGADAVLTRTANVSLLPAEGGGLNEDLKARADMANLPPAHLFVSIHHNSDIYHPEKDQSEVYFKLTDPNPSLDFAKELNKEFQKRPGLPKNLLLGGNYRVLRLSQGPAVLGEACYLSNEKSEAKLQTLSFVREEAEIYYAAILNYFQKGQPWIYALYPHLVVLSQARPMMEAFLRDSEGGGGIDPSTILFTLNGRIVEHRFDSESGRLSYHPMIPLSNGPHSFRIEARNFLGNAAMAKEAFFSVSLPPGKIRLQIYPPELPPWKDGLSSITAEVFDENGNPVADGWPVEFAVTKGEIIHSDASTRNGKATAYLIPPSPIAPVSLFVRTQGAEAREELKPGKRATGMLILDFKDETGNPLKEVQVSLKQGKNLSSDGNGRVIYLRLPGGKVHFTARKHGYAPTSAEINVPQGNTVKKSFFLKPLEGGALFGKSFIIDPEFEGEEEEKIGQAQIESARANLTVANALKSLLEKAGARVAFTHASATPFTALKRLLTTSRCDADYLIILAHRKNHPHVGHYYRSPVGENLARSIRRAMLAGLGYKKVDLEENLDYLIIQSSMPAVFINLSRPDGMGSRTRAQKEVKAIYRGIVSFIKKSEIP